MVENMVYYDRGTIFLRILWFTEIKKIQKIVVTSHTYLKYQTNPDLTNSSDSFTNLKFRIYKKNTNSCYFLTVKLSKKPVLDQFKKFGLFFNCSSWEKFVEKISEINWWKYLMNSLLKWEFSICHTWKEESSSYMLCIPIT